MLDLMRDLVVAFVVVVLGTALTIAFGLLVMEWWLAGRRAKREGGDDGTDL